MRLTKVLLAATAVTTASLLFSGCASHTANGKNHTVLLGGLYESQDGAYEKQPASTLPLNSDAPSPGSKLTGKKVSVLWGLISYRNQ